MKRPLKKKIEPAPALLPNDYYVNSLFSDFTSDPVFGLTSEIESIPALRFKCKPS